MSEVQRAQASQSQFRLSLSQTIVINEVIDSQGLECAQPVDMPYAPTNKELAHILYILTSSLGIVDFLFWLLGNWLLNHHFTICEDSLTTTMPDSARSIRSAFSSPRTAPRAGTSQQILIDQAKREELTSFNGLRLLHKYLTRQAWNVEVYVSTTMHCSR